MQFAPFAYLKLPVKSVKCEHKLINTGYKIKILNLSQSDKNKKSHFIIMNIINAPIKRRLFLFLCLFTFVDLVVEAL